jgi:hypothetical protein
MTGLAPKYRSALRVLVILVESYHRPLILFGVFKGRGLGGVLPSGGAWAVDSPLPPFAISRYGREQSFLFAPDPLCFFARREFSLLGHSISPRVESSFPSLTSELIVLADSVGSPVPVARFAFQGGRTSIGSRPHPD